MPTAAQLHEVERFVRTAVPHRTEQAGLFVPRIGTARESVRSPRRDRLAHPGAVTRNCVG
jgi:hypothetical protein